MVPLSHAPSILTHHATQAVLFGSILHIRLFGFYLERRFESKILTIYFSVQFSHSVVCVWLFVTAWTGAHQASLSITSSWSLFKLMSIESVMPPNHLILCPPLLLLPPIFVSIRVFSNESVLRIRWPKYWSFSFSISLSNEYPELISFRMGWLDLLAGTLRSLLQHHSSKASILQCSALFIVQFSHPYTTLVIVYSFIC